MRRFASIFGWLAVSLVVAQGNRGSITGTITDNSGSAVPGVEVAVTNIETGEVTRVTSNDSGTYSALNLAPGRYSLKFTKEGFKPIEVTSFTLLSTQVAKLDQALEVGTLAQEVTVTDEAPVLESENATISTHLTGKVVTDLPLSIYGGRQVESFAVALTPGYSPISSPYLAVINGTQGFTKEVTVAPPPRRRSRAIHSR